MCTVLDQQLLTSPDMFFSPASHIVINQVELIVHLLWRPKNSICLRRILWTFISACLWKWQTGMYFEVHIVHSNSEVPHSVTPGARFTEPVQIQSIQCQYLHWVCKPFVLCWLLSWAEYWTTIIYLLLWLMVFRQCELSPDKGIIQHLGKCLIAFPLIVRPLYTTNSRWLT